MDVERSSRSTTFLEKIRAGRKFVFEVVIFDDDVRKGVSAMVLWLLAVVFAIVLIGTMTFIGSVIYETASHHVY